MTLQGNMSDRNWSRRLPLGFVFALSAMFLGFVIGGWFASAFIVTSQGMVAGAEVVLSGFVAALLAACISAIFVFRLTIQHLTIAAVASAALALAGFAILSLRMERIEEARQDPESDYADVAVFSASVEQLIVTDPYLRVKIEVESRSREWVSTGPAPDNQVCRGKARAAKLLAVSDALKVLALMDQAQLDESLSGPQPADRRLSWTFDAAGPLADAPGLQGAIEFSEIQLRAVPEAARAVAAMGLVSASPTSPVKCD